MADSASDKAHEVFVNLLKDGRSPAAKAVIECANAAYSIGQNSYSAYQSQDIESELSGIFQSGAQCAQAVDDANAYTAEHPELPRVALQDIQDKTHVEGTWRDTNILVEDIMKFIEDGLLAHLVHR